jgi:protein-tyrosine phosphatase
MDAYPLKWITPSLAVAYAPRSESDLKTIQAAGVRAIVNLCAECYDLEVAEKAAGFEVYFLPVVDEAAPGMEALESLLDWMRQQVDSGNPILVHCRYGMGAQEQSCWPSCCILDTVSRKPAR